MIRLAALLIVMGFQAADVATTVYALRRGYHEMNPLVRAGIRAGGMPFAMAAKLSFALLSALWLQHRGLPVGMLAGWSALPVVSNLVTLLEGSEGDERLRRFLEPHEPAAHTEGFTCASCARVPERVDLADLGRDDLDAAAATLDEGGAASSAVPDSSSEPDQVEPLEATRRRFDARMREMGGGDPE